MKKRAKWKQIKCSSCDGRGLVPSYHGVSWGFDGPKECGDCYGKGSIWMSEKGALAVYPGGPFVGRVPIKWDAA